MLTRGIDLDDRFDLFEERLVDGAKRICTALAVAALTICGLDLISYHSFQSTTAFAHTTKSAALSRSGDSDAELAMPITAAIPRDAIATTQSPALPLKVAIKADDSPVAELAAVHHLDAVEVAMGSLPVMAKATEADLAQWAQEKARQARAMVPPDQPASGTMQLASLNPSDMPAMVVPQPPRHQISLPATISVLPPLAPGTPPLSPAQRLHLEGAARAKAERCLANAIYFEARDQPYKGQIAVAQVVINRVFSGIYPRDVCGVVYQNADRHLACQFTFACDGKRDVVTESPEWRRAKKIAQETLDGVVYVEAVGTATHYHANYVHPDWVHEMHRLAREGEHLFYRPIAWGNGSDEPIWSRAQKAFLKLSKKR